MAKPINILQLVLLLTAAFFSPGYSAETGFFYLQEEGRDLRDSCGQIFAELRRGKEDVGGVVRSLKTINTLYLLDDYDNVMTRDRRKDNYLTYEGLQQEVSAGRRERFCRIELALYLQKNQRFSGPAYEQLVADALQELDETYAAAERSYQQERFERAAFAFDLIAPYRDARERFSAASDQHDRKLLAQQAADQAEDATGDRQVEVAAPVGEGGAILRAFQAELESGVEVEPMAPGPIALAARPGPIRQAAAAGIGTQ